CKQAVGPGCEVELASGSELNRCEIPRNLAREMVDTEYSFQRDIRLKDVLQAAVEAEARVHQTAERPVGNAGAKIGEHGKLSRPFRPAIGNRAKSIVVSERHWQVRSGNVI